MPLWERYVLNARTAVLASMPYAMGSEYPFKFGLEFTGFGFKFGIEFTELF